jgi:hypothetical protein
MNIVEQIQQIVCKTPLDTIKQLNDRISKLQTAISDVQTLNNMLEELNHKLLQDIASDKVIIEDLNKKIVTNSVTNKIDEYLASRFTKVDNIAYTGKRTSAIPQLKKVMTGSYDVFINEFITPQAFEVQKFKKSLSGNDDVNWFYNYGAKLKPMIRWIDENNVYAKADEYIYPAELLTFMSQAVDCVAEYEQIRTKDGLRSAKEIKVGDIVLSYDFDKSEYVWKPIVKKWDKGILPIKRVHFRNGSHIDVTENHHMAVRDTKYTSKEKIRYVKKDLKDVNFSDYNNSWKRKVPIVTKAPYVVKDNELLTEDLCFVIGHYLAEGYSNKYHVETSGHEVYEYVCPRLDSAKIPYSIRMNNSNCPVLTYTKSWFRDLLLTIQSGSFKLCLPEEWLWLPKNKLQAILDGYFVGDGHVHLRDPNKKLYELIYSTSSDKFAQQLQIIHHNLGKSVSFYHQINHQGSGKRPIWRVLNYCNNDCFKSYGHDGLSEVSIATLEDIGKSQCYDWEVADTHNFVFANGIITYQCEDMSFVTASVRPEICGIAYGIYHNKKESKDFGHAWPVFVYKDELYVVELTTSQFEMIKLPDDRYDAYYYVTAGNTYKVKDGIAFGFIAAWD